MTPPEAPSPDAATAPIFDLEGVYKRRSAGDATFELRVERLAVRPGDKIAVTGRSGSGKSTLLDMLALILRPNSCQHFSFRGGGGEALDVARYWRARDQAALSRTRRRHIGYVLQSGGLLPYLSVADNIDLPRRLLGLHDDGTVRRLAEQLGLASHLRKRPGELSVGERQRVAVARAFAHDPCIILADEPTASLDPLTGDAVMALFMEQVERRGVAAVVASHEWHRLEAAGLLPLAQSISADTAAKRVSVVFSR